jgi:cyclase
MLTRRVIPCLDVRSGRVVKGVRFASLRDMGDPAAHARFYDREGADEIVMLDVTASSEGRAAWLPTIEAVADALTVPLTVGGGVRSVEDVRSMLAAGADRVSLNTAAVEDPPLIAASARRFGVQCVVVAVDARRVPGTSVWEVVVYGGRKGTGRDAIAWLREAELLGAGEILLTSMDRDGTLAGYDLDLLRAARSAVGIPIIASGGAGRAHHFVDAFREGGADAVLAASLFHDRTVAIGDLKTHLSGEGVHVRWPLM